MALSSELRRPALTVSLIRPLSMKCPALCHGASPPREWHCRTECGDFKHLDEAAGRVPLLLAPATLGSSLAPAHKGTGSRQNNRPQLVRPPPFRPGTDSDNHPFCNKQETSLPASKIEQTKTPKYEALTAGQLRFLTLLPDSLKCMCFVLFVFHTRKCLAMSF